MVICEFCNKEYKNKYTLKSHQINTKKCLLLQSPNYLPIKSKDFKCEWCERCFTRKRNLVNHYTVCIQYITHMIEEKYESLLEEKENEIFEINTKNDNKIFEITTDKDNEIFEITAEKDQKRLKIRDLNRTVIKLQNRIDEMTNMAISKPSIVQNTTNNTVHIDNYLIDRAAPITVEWINKDKNISKLTLNHILGKGQGIGQYAENNILIENRNMVCLDQARHKYKYLAELKKPLFDSYMKKFITSIYKSIIATSKKLLDDHRSKLTPCLDMSDPSSLDQLQDINKIFKQIHGASRGEDNEFSIGTRRYLSRSSVVIPREQIC